MRVAVLFSGGKDSTFAAHLTQKEHQVAVLLTMLPDNEESFMFHTANLHAVPLLAECMDIPLVTWHTQGLKEDELADMTHALQKLKGTHNIDAVGCGAIRSQYQYERVSSSAKACGLAVHAPLWHLDEREVMGDEIDAGIEAVFVSLAAEGFDGKWLGRRLDATSFKDLLRLQSRYRINVSGEGGEYETLVLDAPWFRKRLVLIEGESSKEWHGNHGSMSVAVRIEDK